MMLEVYRKNDLTLAVTVKGEDGAALNLTGAALSFVVKSKTETVATKTVGSGITLVDAEAGEVEISLTSVDTDINPGEYLCELLVTDTNEKRYVAFKNRLRVLRSLHA